MKHYFTFLTKNGNKKGRNTKFIIYLDNIAIGVTSREDFSIANDKPNASFSITLFVAYCQTEVDSTFQNQFN